MIAITPNNQEWYTPPEILDKVYAIFPITLDPCSPPTPNVKAEYHYTKEEDGLRHSWYGNIFLNPPYGRELPKWICKLTTEYENKQIKNAIALVPVKTDTKWFRTLLKNSCCWVSLYGRVKFIAPDGQKHQTGTFGSCLVLLTSDKSIREKFIRTFQNSGDIWKRETET